MSPKSCIICTANQMEPQFKGKDKIQNVGHKLGQKT